MEQAGTYIPVDRRMAMAAGGDLPDRARGAALFADVSGFTPLTEAMAAELGPKHGAEEVTQQLNRVYSAVIAEVDRYRGSVIGFSGDAVTCWFDADDGRRAVTCGLAIEDAMRQFAIVHTPNGTTVSLAIKVAITAGPVRRFVVGDPGVQLIDVLAGATLDRLAAAEHHANKGEIVTGAEVVAALGSDVSVQAWLEDEDTGMRFAVLATLTQPALPTPWEILATGTLPDADSRAWLHAPVYDRLLAGQEHYLAELRPAVALFLRFSGIDYDGDPAAGDKMDRYIRWAQGIILRHEGALIQLTVGDKGCYLYASFGALLAHDDDAERAVATALELRRPPLDFSYIRRPQIGIARGRIRAGPYGGPTRRTYGAMGDAVNLAARLMSRAERDEILVSQPIADAVGAAYDLSIIGPVSVKGKQAPVIVSRVRGRRVDAGGAAARYSSPLIGREPELARIADVLEGVTAGQGQILRLEGAAGVGKSHLAAAMTAMAAARGMPVTRGNCEGATEGVAYGPWRQVLSGLLGLSGAGADEEDTPEERQTRYALFLEASIYRTNPDWLVRLPLLGDLMGVLIPDNATTKAFEPRLRQSALFDLVIEIMQRHAQGHSLLIVIDEAHVMDEASRSLTVAIGKALIQMPALLALVHRPSAHDAPVLPQLDALPFHTRLTLADLSPDGVATLCAGRLDGTPDPLALSLIQVESQGNPFFVEELVTALRESGSLVRAEDGTWELSQALIAALKRTGCLTHSGENWIVARDARLSSVNVGLPDSIEGIVLSRIDRLPEAPKLTLKVASVVGATFPLDVVGQAHPVALDEDALNHQAGVLVAREFTRLEAPQWREYMFNHAVTRDVAYETLLFDQRRHLHQAVGNAIERLAPDAIPQLAHHTFLGEEWSRALLYQYAAGQQAKKLFANQEGIEHLRKALLCASKLAPEETVLQRQQINITLGELLAVTGQYDAAMTHLHNALALAQSLADGDAQARACRWIAYVHEFRSEYPQALDWIQNGLAALGDRKTAATAELLAIAALIATRQGNYERALEHCEACIRIAGQLNEASALAFAHNSRGIIAYNRGHNSEAIDDFKRAAALYEQAENIHGQAMSYNGLGNASQNLGLWTEAYTYMRQARDIFLKTGDEMHRVFAENNLGEVARNQGRLDAALSYYEAALRTVEKLGGSVYVRGVLHMNLGATFIWRGDIAQAHRHLATSGDLFVAISSRDFLPELHRHKADAARMTGDLALAEMECREALALAREMSMRGEEGIAARILGEVLTAQNRATEATVVLADSVAILKEVNHEFELARGRMALARAQLALDSAEPALGLLDESLAVFERLEAAPDLQAARELRAFLLSKFG